MPKLKAPASLTTKMSAVGGLFTVFHTGMDPLTAVIFALVTLIVAAKV